MEPGWGVAGSLTELLDWHLSRHPNQQGAESRRRCDWLMAAGATTPCRNQRPPRRPNARPPVVLARLPPAASSLHRESQTAPRTEYYVDPSETTAVLPATPPGHPAPAQRVVGRGRLQARQWFRPSTTSTG